MSTINGTLFAVYHDSNKILYATGAVLTTEQDLADLTTKDSGGNADHLKGLRKWEISFEGRYDESGVGLGAEEIMALAIAGATPATIKFKPTDDSADGWTGSGTINNIKIVRDTEQAMNYSGSIQGSGLLEQLTHGTAPVFVSAAIVQLLPTKVVITMDQALDETSTPATTDFTLAGKTISLAEVVGSTVILTVSVAYAYADAVTVSYTKPVSNQLKGLVGGIATESFSGQTVSNNITHPLVINDGNGFGWYIPATADDVLTRGGADEAWYDMLVGKSSRGSEEASGNCVKYGVYEITATQTNHFFTGCGIGDIFAAADVYALDSNNKVKRVLGNHLAQGTLSFRPVAGLFDGVDNYMTTPVLTLNQPHFIYMVMRQVTWTLNDTIIDGTSINTNRLYQSATTPRIRGYAGTIGAENADLVVNTWSIVRILFNGASSKLIVNAGTPITGNFGANNAGGLTIGVQGNYASTFSNIEVKEIVSRKLADSAGDEALIYNYLKAKYGL